MELEKIDSTEEESDGLGILQYQLLGNSVSDITKRDTISCMDINEKFMALGTHMGVVYLLDVTVSQEVKRFLNHSSPVVQICLDQSSEFVVTCAEDGKIFVSTLFDSEPPQLINMNEPVLSIALSPNFRKTKEFVCGTRSGKVILRTPGWWSDTFKVLHSGEGAVRTLNWNKNHLLLFSTDVGVRMYHFELKKIIAHIPRPPHSPHPEHFRCFIFWESAKECVVAWGNYLQWIGLNKTPLSNYEYLPDRSSLDEDDDNARSKASPKKDYLNEKSTIVMSQTEPGELTVFPTLLDEFKTDFMISGVSPMGNDFIFLAYLQDESTNKLSPPELHIITRHGEPLSVDTLEIANYHNFKATDYSLCNLVTEGKYYISSPKCVIIATPNDERTAEENKKTLAANFAKLFQNYEGVAAIDRDIKVNFMELLEIKDFSALATLAPVVFGDNPSLWSFAVRSLFSTDDALNTLIPTIPIRAELKSVFETIFARLLDTSPASESLLANLILKWDGFFDKNTVAEMVRSSESLSQEQKQQILDRLSCEMKDL